MSFRIQSEGARFRTGISPTGTQYIVGTILPVILVYSFDALGEMLERTVVPLKSPPRIDSASKVYVTDSSFLASMDQEIQNVLDSHRVSTDAITVNEFYDEEYNVGIKDLPDSFTEFLENPNAVAPEDRQGISEDIADWRRAGRFVLSWGTEHWMSQNGEMLS